MSGSIGEEIMAGYYRFWLKVILIIAIIIGLLVFLIIKACSYDRAIKVFADTKIIDTTDGHYLCYYDSHSIHIEHHSELRIELLKNEIERLKKKAEELDRERLKKLMEGL